MGKSLKSLVGSLVVLGLVFGLYVSLNAMGGVPFVQKTEDRGQKIEVKPKNERLKPKIQRQVGTPTVQQLLDKVESNYHKIQDLKADMVYTTEKPGGWGYPIMTDKITKAGKYYFKAPDKLKYEDPNDHQRDTVWKGLTEYCRQYHGANVPSTRFAWYFILEPDYLPFYWRLDEIILRFDCRVISNPQIDIWVIEAVPKASNPKDRYNYPLSRVGLEIYIDYEKGVMTKIVDFDAKTGEKDTPWCEIKDFKLISNIWVPTKFIKTTEVTEEITLSNIQINTGIPDSEFEF
ncbi:MAG: hypothetical protein QME42_10415 [bacterium]|nr:hypothetical protein [bacterium]